MNILKFLNLLSFVIWCSGAVAQPMYCDDMLRRGLNTPEQMKGCLVRQTPQQVRPLNSNLNVIQPTLQQPPPLNSNLNVNLPAPPATNIETKFFSDEELLAASSGKSLFAISEGFEGSNFLSTRLTDGNVLCAYLGYEVATKSTISSKLTFEETRKGVIVKSGLGGGARRPEFLLMMIKI